MGPAAAEVDADAQIGAKVAMEVDVAVARMIVANPDKAKVLVAVVAVRREEASNSKAFHREEALRR